ncbi:hypothetical protein EMCRGX_G033281 [Ephydatia muelleri]
MSSESPTRQRLHLQGSFSSPEEKDMFLSRFEAARQLLVPGVTRNATISVLNALLDRVLQQTESVPVTRSGTSSSGREMMLDSAGIYTGDEDPSDQDLFVVERNAFKRLCSGIVQHCGCLTSPSWTLASFKKKTCSQSTICLPKVQAITLVRAFTCAGMVPRQYMNFCIFAGLGEVKQRYIHSVYVDKLYQQIISDAVEESMKAVVDRVKANPDCITSGEYLVWLEDHRVAQTREVVCTKMVLPQVIARGLNITEVAHDYQATIKKYIEELGMMNSYDTWHARSTKVQLCCCMKNCAGNPDILRAMIMNISKHFQGDHHSCYSESPCQQPGVAIEALELEMEREADFLRCSKLNVYAEFNKMVQAIARLGPRQSQMRFTQGTSEEYRFYANLANLLRQVINNPDAIRQREDLQQVYQWFHHNKPLVTQTIKPSQRKPTIAFSDRRPQTTPLHISSLHETQPPLPGHTQRPHTTLGAALPSSLQVESLSDIAEEQGDFRDVIAVSSQGSWAGSHSRRSPIEGRSPVEGGIRSPMEGGIRSPIEGGKRSSMEGGKRSTSPMEESKRSPMEGCKRSSMEGGIRSSMEGGKRSPMEGDKRSSMEGGKRSPMEGGKRSPMEGDKRSSMERGKRSASPMEESKRSPMKGGKRSPMERRSPMEEEKNSSNNESRTRMQAMPAIVSFPPEDFLANSKPRLNSVTFGSILDKAVGIAADMTLQREEILEFHRAVKNTLVRPATVPMAITSTQASVPVANADLEHGHGTQIAASSSSEGNTLSCNKTNSEHRDSTFQGGATDGPHPTSQGGATDGPHPTSQGGATDGPHPTSQGGATDGPHPTSQGGATDGPHPTSQGGATDGPHPTSQGGATDGPHPTQLGVCPAMRVGSEPRPLTREGIRTSSSMALNTVSLELPECYTPYQNAMEPGDGGVSCHSTPDCRPLHSPTKKSSRVIDTDLSSAKGTINSRSNLN